MDSGEREQILNSSKTGFRPQLYWLPLHELEQTLLSHCETDLIILSILKQSCCLTVCTASCQDFAPIMPSTLPAGVNDTNTVKHLMVHSQDSYYLLAVFGRVKVSFLIDILFPLGFEDTTLFCFPPMPLVAAPWFLLLVSPGLKCHKIQFFFFFFSIYFPSLAI